MSNKILIVEDEFVVANDLRLILIGAGYQVTGIASSAERAEELLQKEKPDIVLLDIRLEGKKTGIDIARKLRTENIAFVYLSAHSNQKILEEAKSTEPYGFLVKPFREKDLLVTLDIAWYRYRYGLESKLQQRVLLQTGLGNLVGQMNDTAQSFLIFSQLIQSFIPFDLIMMGIRPADPGRFNDIGYSRVGFNEYQFIGERELTAMAGLKNVALSSMVEDKTPDSKPAIIDPGLTNKKAEVPSLQKLVFECFKLMTCLECTLSLSDGQSVCYRFYSRKPEVYNQSHIDLWTYLSDCLTKVSEKMFFISTPLADTKSNSNSIAHQKHESPASFPAFNDIIGKNHLLVAALDLVVQVAPYTTSVLILGESGTGKEKVAKAIHLLSPRKSGPFIKVNCAAIPLTLVESELFGHEKGAFTGAIEKRKGKFEQADGGTIFLDEVGELPLEIQVKLLRVLQEREIECIGASSARKVNVRIVAATNRNLEREVSNGRFRLDLYYRLCVFPITLPPLRERKSDIPALANFFAGKFCKEFDRPFAGIADSMLLEMDDYDWPGNIRELENILEQSVILNDGHAELALRRSLKTVDADLTTRVHIGTLDDVKQIQRKTEKEYIISILKKASGRIRGGGGAAELLNLKPTTLESKIAKLGIVKEDYLD
jgi:DNA-binding NtrC family response regulator